ncbi:LOW QUALITY PROTEIN: uncharacterized protein RBU57_013089 [Macrochelys suwanniensis]
MTSQPRQGPPLPPLLLPAFPGAALLLTSPDVPGGKLIVKLKPEGAQEPPRAQTIILTGAPAGWAPPRRDGAPLRLQLATGIRTILLSKAGEEPGPRETPPAAVARAPPTSDPSASCTSKGVYENYRRWQRYKALARRHFPGTPDAEALACFFIPVLRSLTRLRPELALEEGVPRAVQEWERSSNFERMIFYEMAEKFMEFEAEEELQIQKMKLLSSSQFHPPPADPPKLPGPPAPDTGQQQDICTHPALLHRIFLHRPRTFDIFALLAWCHCMFFLAGWVTDDVTSLHQGALGVEWRIPRTLGAGWAVHGGAGGRGGRPWGYRVLGHWLGFPRAQCLGGHPHSPGTALSLSLAVYIPKKAASKGRQPRRRQRRPPGPPAPGEPREIPPEAVRQYAEIMEGLRPSWEEEAGEAGGRGEPQSRAQGALPDPALLQYVEQLCEDESFVCKVSVSPGGHHIPTAGPSAPSIQGAQTGMGPRCPGRQGRAALSAPVGREQDRDGTQASGMVVPGAPYSPAHLGKDQDRRWDPGVQVGRVGCSSQGGPIAPSPQGARPGQEMGPRHLGWQHLALTPLPHPLARQVEAVIHPQFLAQLLSPEKRRDPLDLSEELEQELGLTPSQVPLHTATEGEPDPRESSCLPAPFTQNPPPPLW